MSGMQMPMEAHETSQLPSPHAGSGTGWQPASVPEHEWMRTRGGWELMAHGTIFADYNHQGGPRGEGKAESVNVGMLMEQHRLGRGTILLRADVFGGIADFTASGISGAVSDGGDLSRRVAG